ncbi:rho GTPase-activating protein 25 isoform X1 [Osmerus eperlanus]|uniref:rho GTPase-activating protein 25 isoform X1 n=2 Tax=Osmerus eperlanus TaxID=29151 RepID=UPI002E151A5C
MGEIRSFFYEARIMSLKIKNWDFSTFKADTTRITRSKSVMPGESSPGSGSAGSSGTLERPVKAGWLKKQQRSIVKNWQQRYFVLRGSTLTYQKDDKESPVQGVIQLRFSKVNELPLNSDDPGKFLFEIIPRSSGDRERCPYVLMATSQTEMEEWVRSLRRVIGVPTSGVFGKSLGDTVAYEQRFGPHMVPILVQKCAEYIREHGLSEEGIFRLPGQDNSVKQFRDAFDAGERPSFPSDTDVHTVASLFKLYLRELPEPVVPWTQYQDFLDSSRFIDPNSATGRDNLERQISLLPRENYNLLSYICRFLYEVQLNSKVNKMSVENLATVIGINLLKPQVEDPITMMKGTPQIQKLMTVMIRQHEALFPPSKDVVPPPPRKKNPSKNTAPRSFVGWESAECEASLSESPEEEDDSPPPGDQQGFPTSPLDTLQPLPPSGTDPWSGSPRKRTQTLPSFNCPVAGVPRRTEALNRWSKIQEVCEEKGEKTLSEDIFKILDLRGGSLFGGDQTCTTSKEEGDRTEAGKGSDVMVAHNDAFQVSSDAQASSRQQRPALLSVPVLMPRTDSNVDHQTDSQNNTEQLNSLQRKNAELSATVAELRTTLQAERQRAAALELRARSAEGGRDEAQRRTLELDREVRRLRAEEPEAPT